MNDNMNDLLHVDDDEHEISFNVHANDHEMNENESLNDDNNNNLSLHANALPISNASFINNVHNNYHDSAILTSTQS